MELKEVLTKRKSIRKFQPWPVPDLTEVLRLAQTGPSAGAIRGWEVLVTTDKIGPYEAPLYIVICTNQEKYEPRYGGRGHTLYSIQDAAVVTAYLQLLLVEMGLASCWIGAFNENRVKRAVNAKYRPVAMLAVGYAVTPNGSH